MVLGVRFRYFRATPRLLCYFYHFSACITARAAANFCHFTAPQLFLPAPARFTDARQLAPRSELRYAAHTPKIVQRHCLSASLVSMRAKRHGSLVARCKPRDGPLVTRWVTSRVSNSKVSVWAAAGVERTILFTVRNPTLWTFRTVFKSTARPHFYHAILVEYRPTFTTPPPYDTATVSKHRAVDLSRSGCLWKP